MKIARAIHQWGRRSPAPSAKHQKTIARHTEKYDRRHSRVMTRIQSTLTFGLTTSTRIFRVLSFRNINGY
ncbi:hypothetical protein U771_28110 [Pseudomonas gorinensis]|uniref:Uncharacterized protein n=1 Tax=Pseudomonas gorinensis TaxID=3240790 RepID=A0ACA7PDV7_9PSED|nr:hypothetical protein U771_28110 [Pseudomonas sp. TKP]